MTKFYFTGVDAAWPRKPAAWLACKCRLSALRVSSMVNVPLRLGLWRFSPTANCSGSSGPIVMA